MLSAVAYTCNYLIQESEAEGFYIICKVNLGCIEKP